MFRHGRLHKISGNAKLGLGRIHMGAKLELQFQLQRL